MWADHGENIAIVENVRDGSTVRARLLLSESEHQFVNVAMAGVRTPRASTKQGEPSEQWGEEVIRMYAPCVFNTALTLDLLGQAKFFTESRLLQRRVQVTLLSLPQSTATPFQAGPSNAPAPATIFIGNGMCCIFHRF